MNRWRRVGPVLLVVGGLLEAGAYGLAVISTSVNVFLGEMFPRVDVVASGLIGVGLIVIGFALVGRGRAALKVAGVLVAVLDAVQSVIGTPDGPLPGFFTYLTYVAAVTVAGLRVLSNGTLRGGARWSVAVPAICLLFSISGDYVRCSRRCCRCRA